MLPFSYAAAPDTASALSLVGAGSDAAFIAGGTDILQLLQEAVIAPRSLIDINALPFCGVQIEQGATRIGALTRLSDVADDPAIRRQFPLLAQALLETASPQVRNMATVGGNLLQARVACISGTRRCLATSGSLAAAVPRRKGSIVSTRSSAAANTASLPFRATWPWP
jgi:xanthine dehydrogenase YagS FAD-binding subunit